MQQQARRKLVKSSEAVRIGCYRVDLATREVFRGDDRFQLSWRSFEALQLLIEGKSQVVNRDTFFARLWPNLAVGEASLNQSIAKLRRELGEPPDGGVIETVARRGYRLTEAPVVVLSPAENDTYDTAIGEPESVAKPAPSRNWRLHWAWVVCAVAAFAFAWFVLAYGLPRWSKRAQARALTEQGFRVIRENPAAELGHASALFRQAIDLDPSQAPAYAGLAEVMARGVDSSPDQAAAVAERAVALDPRCVSCQAIAGWILMTRQWRFREAARYLERAFVLDPRDPQIVLWHAQMLACSGRLQQALNEIEQARALDFKAPRPAAMRAGILYLLGRYDEAIAAGHETLGLQPNYSSAYEWIYRSQLRLQHVGEAIAARAAMNAAFSQLTPDTRFEQERRRMEAYRAGGLPSLVRMLLAENDAKPALDHLRYERATWKMWIGDHQGAMDELEHVFDFHPFNTIYMRVDPMFAPLRGEKRFQALLSRIGLDSLPEPR